MTNHEDESPILYADDSTPSEDTQAQFHRDGMVKNSSGVSVFEASQYQRLRRFLTIGSEGGSYYESEKELTLKNAQNLLECVNHAPHMTLQTIVEVSEKGLGMKNEFCVTALAIVAKMGGDDARRMAAVAMPRVCRIPTDLYHFIQTIKQLGGWSTNIRRAVSNWINRRTPRELAFHATKYAQRDGWSFRDVLRLAHHKPTSSEQSDILAILKEKDRTRALSCLRESSVGDAKEYLEAIYSLHEKSAQENAALMLKYSLPMEVIPTDKRNEDVWTAFVQTAGMTALLRNAANLMKKGIFQNKDALDRFCARLTEQKAIAAGRLHPVTILMAIKTLSSYPLLPTDNQTAFKQALPAVLKALNDAMFLSFQSADPTGKRFLLALDVSSSMDSSICSPPKSPSKKNEKRKGKEKQRVSLTAREAMIAMAMYTFKAEEAGCVEMWAFSNHFTRLNLNPDASMEEALRITQKLNFSATDCSLPMVHATKNRIPVDVFVIYTDNETNYGSSIHPVAALRTYREVMGIPAKLVIFSATANEFTIADPKDPLTLDVSGMDSSSPQLLAAFARL